MHGLQNIKKNSLQTFFTLENGVSALNLWALDI